MLQRGKKPEIWENKFGTFNMNKGTWWIRTISITIPSKIIRLYQIYSYHYRILQRKKLIIASISTIVSMISISIFFILSPSYRTMSLSPLLWPWSPWPCTASKHPRGGDLRHRRCWRRVLWAWWGPVGEGDGGEFTIWSCPDIENGHL